MKRIILACALAALFAVPALAEPKPSDVPTSGVVAPPSGVPTVDFTKPLKQFDGTDFADGTGKPVEFNLEKAVINALLTDYRDEAIDGNEKGKRYALAMKILNHPTSCVLTSDDVATIKKLVAKAYNPYVFGRMLELIAPNDIPKD